MRTLTPALVTVLALFAASAAMAGQVPTFYLGSRAPDKPADHSVYIPPAEPPRQGGNTIEEAIPITVPGAWTGTTVGYTNNYDEICPYDGSTAPDVVYSIVHEANIVVDIDLCFSSFDTKLYVYDENLNLIACNDDTHFAAPCYTYSSKLEAVAMQACVTYYIVIDGYGSAAGEYQMDITDVSSSPCVTICPAIGHHLENEPPLVDGYQDAHNGGCNSSEFGSPIQNIPTWEFCGVSGWYTGADGGQYRDTDWYTVTLPGSGVLEIIGDAEYPTYMFELFPQDCGAVGVVQSVIIGPCNEAMMTIVGEPGSLVWFWIGPTTFSGPVNEYNYHLRQSSGVPSRRVTVDPRPGYLDAPWELATPWGSVVQGTGYGWVYSGDGVFVLTWGDVPGWTTPAPQEACIYWHDHTFTAHYSLDLPRAIDFDDGEAPYFTVYSGNWQGVDGWYVCQNQDAGVRHFTTLGDAGWTDYRVSVDAMASGTPAREVIFRYRSPGYHYRIEVVPSPINSTALWKRTGCEEMLLYTHTMSDVDGTQPVRLEIIATEGNFQVFVDGDFLFEFTDLDQPHLSGGIGLASYADPAVGWQIASFDNLQIEPLNVLSVAPLPVVTTLSLAAVPNPFNPATVVRFELPRAGDVTIAVHDLRGRLVRTLHRGGVEAGRHEVTWDGRDRSGGVTASGVYLVWLVTAEGEAQAVKITLAK